MLIDAPGTLTLDEGSLMVEAALADVGMTTLAEPVIADLIPRRSSQHLKEPGDEEHVAQARLDGAGPGE